MNSSVSLNTERTLIDYLTPLFPWASCIIGASDRRNVDEDQYGILGEYVTLPAIVVTVADGTAAFPDNPCIRFRVSVICRSSLELSTVDTHNRNATKLADALWDKEAVLECFDDSQLVALAGCVHEDQNTTRNGRAIITEFQMQFEVTSKE